MTNGEKLKEIFPNGVLTSISNSYYWGNDILVSKSWWNAEYKEPNSDIRLNRVENEFNQDKNELEPTTKNDLSSSTRKNSQKLENVSPVIDWNNCHTSEQLDSISTTKNDLGVDWDELKRKIFMEVDGGTDGNWLRYGDVCDNIRAEIMQLDIFYDSDHFSSNKDAMFKCNDILQILDKCEGEVRIRNE